MQTIQSPWRLVVRGGAFLAILACGMGFGWGCGGGTNAGTDAAAEAGGRTCQDIRACIASGCGDGEQACIDQCVQMGSAEAKAAFQTLTACTAPQCPTGAASCACEQQCYAEGLCLAETEACVAAPTDFVCDTFCH